MLTWYNNVMLDKPDSVLSGSYSYVDIRDVALAHVLALGKEEAADQRIIVSAGATTWQETRNLVNELHPQLLEAGITLRGNPDLPKNIAFKYDSTKGDKILGVNYRDFTDTVKDTLADFLKRGWLKADPNASGGVPSAY
ncbi:hypothetical protein HYPSUDRAFT_204662 [Hypholoma sublateritium FD-334 SS-4]|uniref:NAD-dependent epimerase/dehydratase domain-containing protein n=1 Tax=Hypholoma sublateritium (strain FD-334 SS-4) TaxID=945553 RepID=A0A0D2NRC4_HYPSF|nr:hypothetical protein HYPSUDRAFT_204662 [Hypholoma sublateritium FD-334 SS-4]